MLGLFGALNMAGQSLSVQQEATAVAGQNLANVNNTAYARQQLNIEAATPLPTTNGDEGTGVQAISITEVRDALLDGQIQAEGSVTGSLTAQQSGLTEAEGYLNEQLSSSSSSSTTAASSDGLSANLSSFFNSLQSLSLDPSNIADRQAAVESAQELTGQFNQISSGLATVQSTLNSSVQSDVSSSNEDLTQIAALNQQIVLAQSSGGTANDLVDEREAKIEDLAGKVNITASAQTNGAVNISIGGVTMVDNGDTPDSMAAVENPSGNYIVQAKNAGTTLTLSGGSIEGEITARDGTLSTLQSSLDLLASQVIGQVNSVYSGGYDLNGNTGAALFTGTDAENIGVNSNLATDPSAFQASGSASNPGDNTVVFNLAGLANQSIGALGNQTLSQSYAGTVGDFGSSLESVNDQLTNSSSVANMLSTQRSSVSGVDTDTEMTNLMQFQKSYEASAELVTTLNEMLETVIEMKTE